MTLPTGRNLRPSWVATPLGEIIDILDSQRRPVNSKEREKRPGDVPYYGATGQVGWIDDFLFDEELVLLGEDGAPFLDPVKPKAYLIKGKSWVNNHAHVLRAKHGISNRFLLYQLNQIDYRRFVSGTTRMKLPQAPMKRISLAVPPTPEQRRIVAEIEKQFTRLDAAVEALKRVEANLNRYRASVLKAACEGRLVPTEAELARREDRSYEPASELLKRILAERRARWEANQLAKFRAAGKEPKDDKWKAKYKEPSAPDTTSLPMLPEGWAWATTGQVCEIQGGIQKQPSRRPVKNDFPFLRVANVFRDRLDLSEVHRIEVFPGELDKLCLRPGDLLIVEGNGSPTEIGRMAIWTGEIKNCVHQNHIIRARPVPGITPQLISLFWNSPDGVTAVLNVAGSTSGLYTLSVSKVSKLKVPLPPLHEQQRIVAEVERRLSVVDELEALVETNLKRAERLRQAILKRAFEGKLVPQNPDDEPASLLLERIKTERSACLAGSQKSKGAGLSRGRTRKRLQTVQSGRS